MCTGGMHLKYVQLGTRQINPTGNFPSREWVSKLGTCYNRTDSMRVFRSSRNSSSSFPSLSFDQETESIVNRVCHAAQQRIFQFSFVNDIPRVTWSTSNAKIRHNFERQIRIRSSIYSSFDRFAHGTFPRGKCWVSLRNVERKISWKECRLVFIEFINLYLNLDASRIQRILTNYDSFNL